MAGFNLDQMQAEYKAASDKDLEKYEVLKDLDLFILDNSIRETTVAQIRGHTLDAKWKIYNEVKKMGVKDIILASFGHNPRVDDDFLMELKKSGEDMSRMWAFSEIYEGSDWDTPPIGIQKLNLYDIRNVIFEVNIMDAAKDGSKVTVADLVAQTKKWMTWCKKELPSGGKFLVNFRDPYDTMPCHYKEALDFIARLGQLEPGYQPMGLIYEEATGHGVPEEIGVWSRYFRKTMDSVNWKGELLIHCHEKYGLCHEAVLQALKNGATGVWAGVCHEGAGMGHTPSINTLINLIRFGNTKVLDRYNCTYMRQAAINVNKQATGFPPPAKTPIYGERAVDFVFSMDSTSGMGGSSGGSTTQFDMAEFFGIPRVIRLSTLSSVEMYQQKLINVFGENPDFTMEIAEKMKQQVIDDLANNRKEEYMSAAGLAVLYDRAGGQLTSEMANVVSSDPVLSSNAKNLIADVREAWDRWDNRETGCGRADGVLSFNSFYNGFMAPYFSCYRCEDTIAALQALDMDKDGTVDWEEFVLYLRWAMRQYPNIKDSEELLNKAFTLGIIPAMKDELVREDEEEKEAAPAGPGRPMGRPMRGPGRGRGRWRRGRGM